MAIQAVTFHGQYDDQTTYECDACVAENTPIGGYDGRRYTFSRPIGADCACEYCGRAAAEGR